MSMAAAAILESPISRGMSVDETINGIRVSGSCHGNGMATIAAFKLGIGSASPAAWLFCR